MTKAVVPKTLQQTVYKLKSLDPLQVALKERLKSDPSFRQTFQAHLKDCFYDAHTEAFPSPHHDPKVGKMVHSGAEKFINLLMCKKAEMLVHLNLDMVVGSLLIRVGEHGTDPVEVIKSIDYTEEDMRLHVTCDSGLEVVFEYVHWNYLCSAGSMGLDIKNDLFHMLYALKVRSERKFVEENTLVKWRYVPGTLVYSKKRKCLGIVDSRELVGMNEIYEPTYNVKWFSVKSLKATYEYHIPEDGLENDNQIIPADNEASLVFILK